MKVNEYLWMAFTKKLPKAPRAFKMLFGLIILIIEYFCKRNAKEGLK